MLEKKIILIIFCFLIGGIKLFTMSAIDGIYTFKVGQFEIFTLVEAEREGNTAILADVDEEMLNRYIHETRFMHTTNAFLIKTPELNILIDTGTGAGGVIVEKIQQIGIAPTDINIILLTHLHFDHFGGLQRDGIANFPNAKIYLSEYEFEYFTVRNINQTVIDVLGLYLDNIETFIPSELEMEHIPLFTGIIPIANYGHTPGHTVFLIESNNDMLIIAGDFLHLALIQFPNPDISAIFDVDQQAAAFSRNQIINYAARNKIPIGGMHIVYPGIGTVEAEGRGYKFTPLQ